MLYCCNSCGDAATASQPQQRKPGLRRLAFEPPLFARRWVHLVNRINSRLPAGAYATRAPTEPAIPGREASGGTVAVRSWQMVEPMGFEPTTSTVQTSRSPN